MNADFNLSGNDLTNVNRIGGSSSFSTGANGFIDFDDGSNNLVISGDADIQLSANESGTTLSVNSLLVDVKAGFQVTGGTSTMSGGSLDMSGNNVNLGGGKITNGEYLELNGTSDIPSPSAGDARIFFDSDDSTLKVEFSDGTQAALHA